MSVVEVMRNLSSKGVLGFLLWGALGAGCGGGMISQVAAGELERGILVTGTGEASAAPDVARVNIGVETRAESASAALSEANQQLESVLGRLAQLGIAERDMQTSQFSITFEQVHHHDRMTEKEGGLPRGFYRVHNSLEITVRDFDKLGQALSAAADAGANQMWGIRFEIDDTQPLVARAREEAVANARRQAESLAALSGVTLGRVVSVREAEQGGGGVPMHRKAMAEVASDVPVRGGELTVTRQVQLLFEID